MFWAPLDFLSISLKGKTKGFGRIVCSAQYALFLAFLLLLSLHHLIFISFKSHHSCYIPRFVFAKISQVYIYSVFTTYLSSEPLQRHAHFGSSVFPKCLVQCLIHSRDLTICCMTKCILRIKMPVTLKKGGMSQHLQHTEYFPDLITFCLDHCFCIGIRIFLLHVLIHWIWY